MRYEANKKHIHVVVLSAALLGLILFVVLPQGSEVSLYIISVALFSGLMAALFFIGNSIGELKKLAEKMSEDEQSYE